MKRILIGLFLTVALSLSVAGSANAQCEGLYGGGDCPSSFNFSLDKKVEMPGKGGSFVDNLSINDPRFKANQDVKFQIVVTNTGNQTIPTLTVVDTLPQYVSYVTGGGKFDSSNKTITFVVNNLGAGKSQTFVITAKTVDTTLLPNEGTVCVVNHAVATDNTGASNSDSAQLCIEKQVLGTKGGPQVFSAPKGMKSTPATGAESLSLLALIPGALSGIYLRRKSTLK